MTSIAIRRRRLTGTVLAVHILRHAQTPVSILLVEKRGAFGRGSRIDRQSSHMLNVRAANMSAFPSQVVPFREVALATGDLAAPSVLFDPAQRARSRAARLVWAVLQEQLEDAISDAEPGVICERLAAELVDVRRCDADSNSCSLKETGAAPNE